MGDVMDTDYLVIGGGSGGCAAARVLAERSGARVTLLESGGTNDRPDVSTPHRWPELLASDANWGYQTTPQDGAAARVHRWPMGRLLGGSSSVNGMKYMRGGPWDYDRWVEMGADGWDSASVYRAYRQLEDYPEGDQSFHGTGGPISLQQVTGDHPLTAAFLSGCEALGFERSEDFNSLDAEGFGLNQLNIAGGRREDAGSALLGAPGTWPNLQIVLGATADRLILDDTGSRVTSVRYRKAGVAHEITVQREVVVASGAIGSPQLLLLSGIGPAADLETLGLSVTVALPGVGKNLHDHIGVPVVFDSLQPIPPSKYQATEVSLYLRSEPTVTHFDMQVTMHQFAAYLPAEYVSAPDAFTFFPGTLKPVSRGSLRLASPDPTRQPVIDPAYLSESVDVDHLAYVIDVSRKLAASKPFRAWTGKEVGPGPTVTSGEDIRNYIRRTASTYYHPAGTCRMGKDDQAVVDNRLKVFGVANLRIADASIMPEIISGNTNAPAMMIGWRAGEFILEDGQG